MAACLGTSSSPFLLAVPLDFGLCYKTPPLPLPTASLTIGLTVLPWRKRWKQK